MRILVHIGLHKTGTTWLQRRIFDPGLLGFYPLDDGKDTYPRLACAKLAPLLYRPHDLEYSPGVFRSCVAASCRPDPDAVGVISDEDLSGLPHLGARDSASIAQRLHAALPEAQVLVVIREQYAMIVSYYYQYLRSGGSHSFESFVGMRHRDRSPYVFDPDTFKYHRLLSHYRQLFGADRIIVLTYEQFRADRSGFLAALCARTGLPFDAAALPDAPPANTGDHKAATHMTRALGPFFVANKVNAYSPLAIHRNHPRRGKDALLRIRRVLDRLVSRAREGRLLAAHTACLDRVLGKDFYSESNDLTRAMTGLSLDGYR